MAKARNITAHTYNEEDANKIAQNIYDYYVALLKDLYFVLKKQTDI